MPRKTFCSVVAVFALATLFQKASCDTCYAYQTVPSLLPAPKYFTVTKEAGLQIFTNSLQIPCDGHLIAWKFVPHSGQVNGLHLAVFRPDANSYANGIARKYRVVGETRIDGLSIANIQQWTTVRIPDSIPVLEGDSIGLFYDDYRISGDKVGVGVANIDGSAGAADALSGFGPASTLVLMSDASQVASGSVIDAVGAPLVERLGGIAAVLHPIGVNSTRCLIPLSNPDVSCTPLKSRYTFTNGSCRLFHGCKRPAEWAMLSNNFDTVTSCLSNCSRLLPENHRATVEAASLRLVNEAGQQRPSIDATSTAPPTFTLPPEWNSRCNDTLKNDDWSSCPPPRSKRWTFNVHLLFCVSFNGCHPGPDVGVRNNWNTESECMAGCDFNRRYLISKKRNLG